MANLEAFNLKWVKSSLAGCVLLMLTGCLGRDEMRWEEQVWLHNNQFILIDRYAAAAKSGFPNSRRGRVIRQEIRYPAAGVEWISDPAVEEPISFDLIDGSVYLATIPHMTKEKFCSRKSGAYKVQFYRRRDGVVQKIGQMDAPLDRMTFNITAVLQWRYANGGQKTYLSWSEVADSTAQRRSGPPTPLKTLFERSSWLRCQ